MGHAAHKNHPLISQMMLVWLWLASPGGLIHAEPPDNPETAPSISPSDSLLPDPNDMPPPLDLPDPAGFPELLVPDSPVAPIPQDEAVFVLPAPFEILPPAALPLVEIRIRAIQLEGNSVVPCEDLQSLCSGWLNRSLVQEDLDELRFRIAGLYLSRGFLNSGAIIPDQDMKDGILRIQLIEGRLTDAIIRTYRENSDGQRTDISKARAAVKPAYFRQRILAGNDKPLRLGTLQNRLQILQSNPNLQRINAELKPGAVPGESILLMEVTESTRPRWNIGMDAHNQRSPSVGGEQLECWAETTNATGFSDALAIRMGLLTGDRGDPEFDPGQTASLRYSRAVTAYDTTLDFTAERQDYVILDEVFSPLDIEGDSWEIGMVVRHPLLRSFGSHSASGVNSNQGAGEVLKQTVQNDVWVGLGFDMSHSETRLLGEPFSISPGYVDGELDLSAVRFLQDWTRRTDNSVLAARSVISFGIDGLGSTDSPDEPDSAFVSWAAHGQYSRRIGTRGDSATLRAGFQWASDPLPSPEQWILGGRYTVRGYPENSLVSDTGWFGAIEYSCMLPPPSEDSNWRFAIVPFLDAGTGWNETGGGPTTLVSCGLGLRTEYADWLRGELFWGFPLSHRELTEGGDIQDDGLHFRLTVSRF